MLNRNWLILLFNIATVAIIHGQSSKLLSEDRSGSLNFKVGSEYRVTPIYKIPEGAQLNPQGFYTNEDRLHNGVAFSYGLELFVSKRLSLNAFGSIRYESFLYPFLTIETDFGAKGTEKTLLLGFHGFLDYHLPVFTEAELVFRLGISTYNGGSEFIYKETFFDENGEETFAIDGDANLQNTGVNVAVGYAKNRTEAFRGFYTSDGGTFYNQSFDIFTPYIRIEYSLFRL